MGSEYDVAAKLYIVLFLHQTTTFDLLGYGFSCCISYYSYIKPQLSLIALHLLDVVYRTIPTSNHNRISLHIFINRLYIVLFLHQTTTSWGCFRATKALYIVLFLHQTTTLGRLFQIMKCCISYYSYIKPQLIMRLKLKLLVVYRTIPTSNHNRTHVLPTERALYIVLFLHQTTTQTDMQKMTYSCISYYSYIKPQRRVWN